METSDFKTDGEAVVPALGATYSVTQEPLDAPHQMKVGKLILLPSLFSRKSRGLYEKLANHLLQEHRL
jgi:hypothetical protein